MVPSRFLAPLATIAVLLAACASGRAASPPTPVPAGPSPSQSLATATSVPPATEATAVRANTPAATGQSPTPSAPAASPSPRPTSPPAPSATTSPTASQKPSTPAIARAAPGACANQYYPVVGGATWTYKDNLGSTTTETIGEVRSDQFQVDRAVATANGTVTVQTTWRCQAEGLVSTAFGSSLGVGTSAGNTAGLQCRTTRFTPVTIPTNIAEGARWKQTFDLECEGTVGSGSATKIASTVEYDFAFTAQETVSVPAGSFDALKIATNMNQDMRVETAKVSVTTSAKSSGFSWLAPGVGFVKSTTKSTVVTGNRAMDMGESTTELVSYRVQ